MVDAQQLGQHPVLVAHAASHAVTGRLIIKPPLELGQRRRGQALHVGLLALLQKAPEDAEIEAVVLHGAGRVVADLQVA